MFLKHLGKRVLLVVGEQFLIGDVLAIIMCSLQTGPIIKLEKRSIKKYEEKVGIRKFLIVN